jgi:hypothetical protein
MGEDALGDGSQWPTLDLGLLLEQRGRRRFIDPLPFHEDATACSTRASCCTANCRSGVSLLSGVKC